MYGHRIALTGPHWNREWKSFNHLPLEPHTVTGQSYEGSFHCFAAYSPCHGYSRSFTGRMESLLGVVVNFALGQRFLQLVNLSLGEGGVVFEIQLP